MRIGTEELDREPIRRRHVQRSGKRKRAPALFGVVPQLRQILEREPIVTLLLSAQVLEQRAEVFILGTIEQRGRPIDAPDRVAHVMEHLEEEHREQLVVEAIGREPLRPEAICQHQDPVRVEAEGAHIHSGSSSFFFGSSSSSSYSYSYSSSSLAPSCGM